MCSHTLTHVHTPMYILCMYVSHLYVHIYVYIYHIYTDPHIHTVCLYVSHTHTFEYLYANNHYNSTYWRTYCMNSFEPTEVGYRKNWVRLIELFPSTEIFSKRRKIYAFWRETRVRFKTEQNWPRKVDWGLAERWVKEQESHILK